jgi:hypothetical protein
MIDHTAADGAAAPAYGFDGSAYAYDQLNGTHYFLFNRNAGNVNWITSVSTEALDVGGWAVYAGGLAANSHMNADGSHDGRVMCMVADNAGARALWYIDTGGAWAVAPGIPAAANFLHIACDRNTDGGATPLWIAGEAANAATPRLFSDNTVGGGGAPAFANVAGFPALGAAGSENIMGVFHSKHPVDALGPSDVGNPTWLVITDTFAVRSTDGAAWTAVAHGLALAGTSFAGAMMGRGAAYSKTSSRWVISHDDDISYSDDNGANWTTLAGVCPDLVAANGVGVACDGYGTFWVFDQDVGGANLAGYMSVDEGLTWERIGIESTTAHPNLNSHTVGYSLDASKSIDDTPDFPEFMVSFSQETASTSYETRRTPE